MDKGPHLSYLADVYYHIGLSYARLEKFEKSIHPLSKCIEYNPHDIRYIHERAKAHQMINYHEESVKDFNKVIKRNPKNAHAYFRRAFSLKALKEFGKAAEDFDTAYKLDPNNPQIVVNHKKLKGVQCIVLCEPGAEKEFI
jgi:tetratricopeptide (TPR) repeat protein